MFVSDWKKRNVNKYVPLFILLDHGLNDIDAKELESLKLGEIDIEPRKYMKSMFQMLKVQFS